MFNIPYFIIFGSELLSLKKKHFSRKFSKIKKFYFSWKIFLIFSVKINEVLFVIYSLGNCPEKFQNILKCLLDQITISYSRQFSWKNRSDKIVQTLIFLRMILLIMISCAISWSIHSRKSCIAAAKREHEMEQVILFWA